LNNHTFPNESLWHWSFDYIKIIRINNNNKWVFVIYYIGFLVSPQWIFDTKCIFCLATTEVRSTTSWPTVLSFFGSITYWETATYVLGHDEHRAICFPFTYFMDSLVYINIPHLCIFIILTHHSGIFFSIFSPNHHYW
jgi:hypothetical protein